MQMDTESRSAHASYAGLAADDLGRSDDRAPIVLLHGLTFDRRMWRPALAELAAIDPDRRAIALDLPGHGESPDAPSYSLEAVVQRIHRVVIESGLADPVVVGHSGSAAIAAVYAAQHDTRGVIVVEGAFEVAGFASMMQSLEPMLRGPGFAQAWTRIATNAFRIDEVTPDVREFVQATSRPRQEIVLGYWQDLFERTPNDLDAWVASGAIAIRQSGVPVVSIVGQDPTSGEVAWLRKNLPDARTEVWSGSGHFPHLAHPRRFAELLASTGSWNSRPLVAAEAH
jgi:pimeloyl-ACP methyl ester carboxylesterase